MASSTRDRSKMLLNGQLASDRTYTVLDIEVDNQCGLNHILSQTACSSTRVSDVTLYRYEDVPNFLRGNPYIKKGYRAYLPASQCFSSLFLWSNETINIWSHLLGCIIFFVAMCVENMARFLQTSPTSQTSQLTDHIYLTTGLLCYQTCMILSAGYHIFYCHSEKASKRWLAMDLTGISIGLIGCYLPAVHLAFYCHQVWRDLYILVVCCLAAVTLGLQFHPRYFTNSWNTTRMVLYSCVAGYGVMPALHWIYLSGGVHAEVVQFFYAKIIVVYLLLILALFFYATKFPECMFPGRVDYIGSSHQWWHLIVVIAFLYWHIAGKDMLEYRMRVPCHS